MSIANSATAGYPSGGIFTPPQLSRGNTNINPGEMNIGRKIQFGRKGSLLLKLKQIVLLESLNSTHKWPLYHYIMYEETTQNIMIIFSFGLVFLTTSLAFKNKIAVPLLITAGKYFFCA